jgi:predicted RNA-binding protein with PIN domain
MRRSSVTHTRYDHHMPHLVVDAMNVIGTRPNGWWRERDGALRLLLARLQQHAHAAGDEVTLVADGRPLGDLPEGIHGGVTVLYAARGGRNAADDRIADLVQTHSDPASLTVITSDRELSARVRVAGAPVRGARWLLEQLDALDARE